VRDLASSPAGSGVHRHAAAAVAVVPYAFVASSG